jgi:hypothetical protein
MIEKDLCKIIVNSLEWGYKIPDPQRTEVYRSAKRPFDIVGTIKNKPCYIEAKILNKPQCFNFDKLQPHQIDSLMHVKKTCPDSYCLLVIGVVYKRGDLRVFVYDNPFKIAERKVNKFNITKKEFEETNYIAVKDGKIDFNII